MRPIEARALAVLAKDREMHQEDLGRVLWPAASGCSSTHGSSHWGYGALMLLGRLRRQGWVRRTYIEEVRERSLRVVKMPSGWAITHAGRKALAEAEGQGEVEAG